MELKEAKFEPGIIRYLDNGCGEAILYIHGMGSTGTEDYASVFAFVPGFRHIAPDLFGFGYSDKPLEYSYSLAEQADSLLKLLDCLGLKSVSIVGHSLGGAIALEIYRQAPRRIKCLILCEGNIQAGGGFISRPIVRDYTEEGFVLGYSEWTEQFAVDEREFCRPGKRQYARTLEMASPWAMYRSALALVGDFPWGPDFFDKIELPRAWITGSHMFDQDLYDRLAASGVNTFIIPRAGHAMMLDKPNEFGEILFCFLKGMVFVNDNEV
jgi:pimeloyl-ACP methyl ester carboxylesterase